MASPPQRTGNILPTVDPTNNPIQMAFLRMSAIRLAEILPACSIDQPWTSTQRGRHRRAHFARSHLRNEWRDVRRRNNHGHCRAEWTPWRHWEDGGDSVSSVAAVYDRRRCLNCCTVGAHRAPLQLGNSAIFKLSHYWEDPSFDKFLIPHIVDQSNASCEFGLEPPVFVRSVDCFPVCLPLSS